MTVEHYAVETVEVDEAEGTAVVRLMPWGKVIEHNGRRITYDPGSIKVGGLVPVNVDHGDGALERVGKVTGTIDDDGGLDGTIKLSDTTLGRDVRTLMRDGVLTDVSAGVEILGSEAKDGVLHLTGRLDHLAIVGHGAFGGVDGSRIMAAYRKGETVGETTDKVDIDVEAIIDRVTETYASKDDIGRLESAIARLGVPDPKPENPRPGNFSSMQEYVLTQKRAHQGDPRARERLDTYYASVQDNLDEYALGNETTTTSAGLVPNYLSQEVLGLIDNYRPFVDSIPSDPIGDYGMSVNYPEVTTKPNVAVQATQKTEVASTPMAIGVKTVALATYAGATDVALQLVERSQPSFLDILFEQLAGVYAERTDAAAIAAAKAAAVAIANQNVVANLGTSATATWAAVAAGVAGILADTKRTPTHFWLSADRFAQLITLVDSTGRPLLTPIPGGQPGQGTGDFTTFEFEYGGLRVVVDPNAASGTSLLGWNQAAATLEQRPQQIRALEVDVLGLEVGIWGLFGTVIKYPGGFWTINIA